MDVAGGRGDPINKSLMAGNAIFVRLDHLQPLPAALGVIELVTPNRTGIRTG
jgi:hypothetical protein